jgi:DNA mismatch repair protein MutL
MSSIINVLDETVINRIAAGEVVERPASVVKELLENAIDAKASHISIEIENGGKKLIRIRDDGIGMSNDDAFLALERHATSKLRTEKDLIGVPTLGFRGEALASIASVSRLRLVTKDDSESEGMEILVEGGTLKRADKLGVGRGSILEVRNLFFNAPVRAKYLKGKALESGYVHDLILRIALANTSIGFKYSEDGRVKIESGPVKSVLDRINSIFSRDVRENLISVDGSEGDMRVHGYVAKPPYARSTMRSILTFVNKRPVKDKLVNSALNRAFTGLMERGRYPLAVLFIDVAPEDVDVNVHPQKNEVRFLNPSKVADLINHSVTQALYDSPRNSPRSIQRFPEMFAGLAKTNTQEISSFPMEQAPNFLAPDFSSQLNKTVSSSTERDIVRPGTKAYSDLSVLGKIPGSFIVLHDDDEILFLDHHAAHERLVFDSLLRAQAGLEVVESQNLLIPKVITLTPVEAELLRANQEILSSSGIICEEFGENDFVVKACPVWIRDSDAEDLIRDLVGTLLETGLKPKPEEMMTELFKTVACKASVKESTQMRNDEIIALLKALDENNSPRVCPHGRPLSFSLTFAEIRRRLGRNIL